MASHLRPDDRGMVAGLEALALGILVFVIGTLLVANAWAVIDAKLAVDAAAREATRAFVEAPSADVGWQDAERAAERTMEGHGRDPARTSLSARSADLRRCALVEMEVRHRVTMLPLALISRGGGHLTVTGRHAERVDALRSGLPGSSPC